MRTTGKHCLDSGGLGVIAAYHTGLADALDIDLSNVEIHRVSFLHSGNDGLDSMGSSIELKQSVFKGAGDKCVSAGERSALTIESVDFYNCNIGIAVKSKSVVQLHDTAFYDAADTAIALFQKNTHYVSGGTVRGDSVYGIDQRHISVSENSRLEFDNNALRPSIRERLDLPNARH